MEIAIAESMTIILSGAFLEVISNFASASIQIQLYTLGNLLVVIGLLLFGFSVYKRMFSYADA